jgi:hypothetical protein
MSNEFWAEFDSLLDKSKPERLEYRLHYDTAGDIYLCTMQQHPENTQYVVVTKDEYDNYGSYTVVGGRLKKIVHNNEYQFQLMRSDKGFKTVKAHAGILLELEDYPEVEYYERRNH